MELDKHGDALVMDSTYDELRGKYGFQTSPILDTCQLHVIGVGDGSVLTFVSKLSPQSNVMAASCSASIYDYQHGLRSGMRLLNAYSPAGSTREVVMFP